MKFTKGQPAWNKGLKTPQSVREKQSKSAIKRCQNPLEKQRMSEIRIDCKMSDWRNKLWRI